MYFNVEYLRARLGRFMVPGSRGQYSREMDRLNEALEAALAFPSPGVPSP